MRVPIFQLDAFTNRRFAGNPAAVMLLERFPADRLMQCIAAENNLADGAGGFFFANKSGKTDKSESEKQRQKER